MSETEKRKIRVFIASPNDLAEERRKFRDAITLLNIGFGDGANVEFVPLGWEDTLASTGRRSQGVINQDIDSCDVFILAMHRRWGQEAPDAKPYSSYTEEEFHRALERWKSSGAPEIFVFFKLVDAASEADPGLQLKQVIDFRKQLEETRKILYHYFDTPQAFVEKIDRHLRAYTKGELPKADEQRDIIVLPIAALQMIEKAKKIAEQKTEEARQANEATEAAQFELAEVAAQLAKEGKIEFAREKFTKLVTESKDLRILFLGYEFFYRTDDLYSAEKVLEKWLSVSGAENNTEETAAALGNLGNLYQALGDFKRSEEMYWKALIINEALGNKEGVSNSYGNLGVLYQAHGELKRSEEMHLKALCIDEMLDRKTAMASNYGNLGNLYLIQRQIERAEEMQLKAVSLNELLDQKEDMARDYNNLGNVYLIRKELEQAENMYKKALSINNYLGLKGGMASQYGSLGNLYFVRGDFGQAEKMYYEALSINESLGKIIEMAISYGNLGNVYREQNKYDMASDMYEKSLSIDKAIDRKEGMALSYANYGTLCKIKGEITRAEKMYEKSIVLYREIGSPNEKMVTNLLQELRDGELSSEANAEQ